MRVSRMAVLPILIIPLAGPLAITFWPALMSPIICEAHNPLPIRVCGAHEFSFREVLSALR